jgi:hypothetical protein
MIVLLTSCFFSLPPPRSARGFGKKDKKIKGAHPLDVRPYSLVHFGLYVICKCKSIGINAE